VKRNILLITLLLAALFLSFLAISITVSPAKQISHKADEIIKECKESRRSDFCYTDAFSEFGKNNDVAKSVTLLRYIQKKDPHTNNCHFIAHVIAFEEMQKHPDNWEELFTKVPVDTCTGGYLMGILEGYQYTTQTALNTKTVPEICNRISRKVNESLVPPEDTCVHIMGHLLLSQEGIIDTALTICKTLNTLSQKECFAGVFMESEVQRNIALHTGKEPLPWTLDSTQTQGSICSTYKSDIAEMCWRELSHMFVFLEESYPPDLYENCQKAPSENSRHECYIHGVGIMTVSSRFDPNHLSLLCQPYRKNAVLLDSCISMAVGTMLGSSPSLAEIATNFCRTLPTTHQGFCYNRFGVGLSGPGKTDIRKKICRKIPEEYKKICLST